MSSEAAVSAVLCDPALHISVCPSFRYLALFDTYLSTASSLYLVVIDPPSPLHPSVWLENGRHKKKNKKKRNGPDQSCPTVVPSSPDRQFHLRHLVILFLVAKTKRGNVIIIVW